MKLSKIVAVALFSAVLGGNLMAEIVITNEPLVANLGLSEVWDKTFKKDENIIHKKVAFKNRYGISIAADLYLPKNIESGKFPAVAISGPYGAVKEQASGLYAQELAKRGFVTLAFDASFTGESGGSPRNISSNDINTEDFSAAVDFLGIQSFVDRNNISILGICGFGGFALNAAAMDTRISKVIASTMYDMSRVKAKGYNDSLNAQDRAKIKNDLASVRYDDAMKVAPTPAQDGLPNALKGDEPKFVADYFNYYKTDRGFHPRSINSNSAWSAYNTLAVANMPILVYSSEITQPALIIHGEDAHSLYFSKDAFKELKGDNKELFIVPKASHTDLYDNVKKIPFDKIAKFLKGEK